MLTMLLDQQEQDNSTRFSEVVCAEENKPYEDENINKDTEHNPWEESNAREEVSWFHCSNESGEQ